MVVPFEELLTNAKKDCSKVLSLVKKLEVWLNSFSNVVKITPMKSSIVSFGTFEFLVQILKKKKKNSIMIPPSCSPFAQDILRFLDGQDAEVLCNIMNDLVVSETSF